MKRLKTLVFWQRSMVVALILAISLMGGVFAFQFASGQPVYAATTQDVTVNATPAYVTISNAPSSFDFGVVTAGSTDNTGNAHFTITNGSSVVIDISINCTAWSSGGSTWTYNDPGADTANLDASGANGGAGGSTGAGDYDISIPNSTGILFCDNVSTVTDPTWELQLDAPSSISYSDEQEITVTLLAVSAS